MGEEDVTACADLLVEASLRGVESHGVFALLPVFAEQAQHGVGRSGSSPSIVSERGAVAVVDGGGASGPRTARVALETACKLAQSNGAGVIAVRRCGYLGALGWSVLPAAEQGLIALAAVNAMAFVAPAGGREPLHGTNPLAIAIPHEPNPIVHDMRTNAFALADYWHSLATGEPLPDGVLIRADGTTLTDVEELERGGWEAAVSLPLAGARGYGLALALDVLTAALAGMPIGREVAWETERDALGAFFLVLDPAAFGAREQFVGAVRRLAQQVRDTAALDPNDPVRLPGERAAMERRRRLEDGIPFTASQREQLEERLAALGLSARATPPS